MFYEDTWDMEKVFPGGSNSKAFHKKIKSLKIDLKNLQELMNNWESESDAPNFNNYKKILLNYENISKGIGEARSFISGLASADTTDIIARKNLNTIAVLAAELDTIFVHFQKKIGSLSNKQFTLLLEQQNSEMEKFPLREIRKQSKKLLSTKEEQLINNLSIDGFQGWENMYNELVATIQVPFEEDGKIIYYSAGQAENKMNAEKDSKKRLEMLKKWEEAWENKKDLFSSTLNHLAGFRLNNQKAHSINDFMEPPLEYNRMQQETLDIMWDTVSKNKKIITQYFERKAQLLGLEKLNWLDVAASLNLGESEDTEYTFTEAANFIIQNFEQFSPKMSKLAKNAFEDRWIEAENRSNKRPGGYCSNLPESEESRIFMTFSGSSDNVSTLAHELGHAFHSHTMRNLPLLNQRYAMNVAETASTFAELIVSDATIKNASTNEEKINLLDEKISLSAVMMMNIHARYLFEKEFYSERHKGIVSADRLSMLMLNAQKEAYVDSLETYHPMFWASKLHFYSTNVPFYNFPYTFGFLFSLGIYARALESDASFEEQYIDLLQDTASMNTEDLAQKHLNVDLSKPDFWQNAIDLIELDVNEFLKLTEKYI